MRDATAINGHDIIDLVATDPETGVEGHYEPARGAYLPPEPYRTWGEVVEDKGLRL